MATEISSRRRSPSRRSPVTEPPRPPGIGRLLAPLALAAVLIATFLVVGSSPSEETAAPTGGGANSGQANNGGNGGGNGGNGGGGGGGEEDTSGSEELPKKYAVEEGDSLTSIADEFGITVDEILQLNPKVDPQALTTGEKLKLR